jgi:rhamnogalacturonyl hydrolase YesR
MWQMFNFRRLTYIMAAVAALCFMSAPPSSADYKQQAEEATDYIQTQLYDPGAQKYWDSTSKSQYGLMWGNGIELAVLAKAAANDPKKYTHVLYDFTNGLKSYWDPDAPVPCYNAYCSGPGGTDKYYDDSAWMVLAYVYAYQTTNDKMFLTLAETTQRFVLSGWDDTLGGGIYWKIDHQSKNTCSNAPAAAGALMLDEYAGDYDQLAWALKIRTWLNGTLQDTDGLYFDNIDLRGKVDKTKWSYNSAMMITTNLLLYKRTNDLYYLTEARRIGDASLAYWTDPGTGSLQRSDGGPIFTHLLCESFINLYETTHDVKYLNAVRREAAFAYRYARDPQGGYWEHWTTAAQAPNQTKTLMTNASAAYIFWLLAPYPDVAALTDSALKSQAAGDDAKAESLFQEAVDSDPGDVYAAKKLATVQKDCPRAFVGDQYGLFQRRHSMSIMTLSALQFLHCRK